MPRPSCAAMRRRASGSGLAVARRHLRRVAPSRSSCRLSASTLTWGRPGTAGSASRSGVTSASPALPAGRAPWRRAPPGYSAASGLISGSSPEAEAVTRSAGIEAPGTRMQCAMSPLMRSTSGWRSARSSIRPRPCRHSPCPPPTAASGNSGRWRSPARSARSRSPCPCRRRGCHWPGAGRPPAPIARHRQRIAEPEQQREQPGHHDGGTEPGGDDDASLAPHGAHDPQAGETPDARSRPGRSA